MLDTDTIAAIASPPGNATLGILRISGPEAYRIAAEIFTPTPDETLSPASGRRTMSGDLLLAFESAGYPRPDQRDAADTIRKRPVPCTTYLMPAPRSYTREHVIEFLLPGAPPLLRAALRTLLAKGARLADPGEFTRRAFLNGRIDLGQAEAVGRLIAAENEADRSAALARLSHRLPADIRAWREELVRMAGRIEAVLDFADEEPDVQLISDTGQELQELADECVRLAGEASTHRPEQEGIRMLLAGLTNAGKSSIANALSATGSALVSDKPFTTRDRLRQEVRLGRYIFLVDDVPGHAPEAEGIDRVAMDRTVADRESYAMLCLVVDSSRPLGPDLRSLARELARPPALLVLNKQDLPQAVTAEALSTLFCQAEQAPAIPVILTSTVTGVGLDELKETMVRIARQDPTSGSARQVSAREATELLSAAEHALAASDLLREEQGLELVAEELRQVHQALSRMLGQGYAEDVLESIFSEFCIGK